MPKIIKKRVLAENVIELTIDAPLIGKAASPGQFIILRIDQDGERIPLSLAGFDERSITIVFLVVGKTTEQLSKLDSGDTIQDLVGPLGTKSEIKRYGTVALVGGGLGIAPLIPQAKAFKKAANKVISVIGARTEPLVICQEELKEYSEVVIATEDGSIGEKGRVTVALANILSEIDHVVAIGPIPMMKAVAALTRNKVRTIASLNPIMLDGTGMCGCCRVAIGGKIKFACVDGPEFDAHLVNWEELANRNASYENHKCRLPR